MTRRIVALTCVAALVAATALAAFKTGNYHGATGKGGGVSFAASAKQVTNFTFSVLLRCSNGAQAANTTTLSRLPIRNGRFAQTTGSAIVHGTLSGSRASGTLSQTEKRLGSNRDCKSGSLKWTAQRAGTSNKGALICAPSATFNGGDLQIDMSCGGGDFDAFVAYVPRPATRADTSTAHLRCLVGRSTGFDGKASDIVNCSAQDGVKLKSGRVLIRFTDNATCADSNKTNVSALRTGPTGGEDGPFPLRNSSC